MKNPLDWSFGSKEWNEYYGIGRGSRAKGDRAKRAGAALKASLTKKGEAAFLEKQRKEWEAAGGKLSKAQLAEDRAMARILPGGKAFALKIARPDGGLFGPGDVEAFLRSGWQVHPAGTAPAKTGSALPAYPEVNPGDSMVRILGPELAARAVVIAGPDALTEDQVHAWRRAGYDVSPAPKALRERAAVAANPSGAEQRKVYEALKKAKSPVGAERLGEVAKVAPGEALAALQRLEALGLAHVAGADLFGALWAPGARERGLFEGMEQAQQPALAFNPGKETHFSPSQAFWEAAGVKPGPVFADLGWIRAKHPNEFHADEDVAEHIRFVLGGDGFWIEDGRAKGAKLFIRRGSQKCSVVQLLPCRMQGTSGYRVLTAYTVRPAQLARAIESCGGPDANLGTGGSGHATHPGSQGLPSGQASHHGGKDTTGNAACKGQERPRAATGPQAGQHAGSMAKTRTNPDATKPQAKAGTSNVQPLKSRGAEKHRAMKELEKLFTPKASKKPKAAAPKATLESATVKLRFNPTDTADVAKVWKLWTGAEVGQVLKLTLDLPERAELPGTVALLGRVSRLIGPDGSYREFKASEAPFMVTDGHMKRLWLLGVKPQAFDTAVSIIAYVTRKPKFGDRGTVEYIHAFKGAAKARMSGHAGEITGTFRLTGRGIEG